MDVSAKDVAKFLSYPFLNRLSGWLKFFNPYPSWTKRQSFCIRILWRNKWFRIFWPVLSYFLQIRAENTKPFVLNIHAFNLIICLLSLIPALRIENSRIQSFSWTRCLQRFGLQRKTRSSIFSCHPFHSFRQSLPIITLYGKTYVSGNTYDHKCPHSLSSIAKEEKKSKQA